MESFFGDKAEQYRKEHLADALMKIPYMVCVDEFQHRVFEKPEMTAMERRAVWSELEKVYMPWRDYDGNAFLTGCLLYTSSPASCPPPSIPSRALWDRRSPAWFPIPAQDSGPS